MDTSDLSGLTQPDLGIGQSISHLLLIMTIGSFIITGIIVVLWIMSWVHRRKVQDAIIDIRDTLREMNERDKLRSQPPRAPVPENIPKIAADRPTEDDPDQTIA